MLNIQNSGFYSKIYSIVFSVLPGAAVLLTSTAVLLSGIAVLLPGIAYAVPEDATKSIVITADEFEVDNNAGIGIYRGTAQVNQGTLEVLADKVTVYFVDQKIVRIIAEGQPAHYKQQIKVDESDVKADAKVITYYTAQEKLDLAGDAYLNQDGNEFQGELIKYDINAGKVDAKGSVSTSNNPAGETPPKKGRVRMILQPAQKPASN